MLIAYKAFLSQQFAQSRRHGELQRNQEGRHRRPNTNRWQRRASRAGQPPPFPLAVLQLPPEHVRRVDDVGPRGRDVLLVEDLLDVGPGVVGRVEEDVVVVVVVVLDKVRVDEVQLARAVLIAAAVFRGVAAAFVALVRSVFAEQTSAERVYRPVVVVERVAEFVRQLSERVQLTQSKHADGWSFKTGVTGRWTIDYKCENKINIGKLKGDVGAIR